MCRIVQCRQQNTIDTMKQNRFIMLFVKLNEIGGDSLASKSVRFEQNYWLFVFFFVVLIHCSYFNAVKRKLPSISQVILANFCILFLFAIAPPTPNIFQKSVFFFCRITNMFRKLLTSDRSTWLSCRNNRIDEKPN